MKSVSPWLFLLLPLLFGVGVFADFFGFRAAVFSLMLLAGFGILIAPIRYAMVFVFLYIGFEGFLKVVSNYHPVVHVGADLMVIGLFLKVLAQQWTGRGGELKLPPFAPLIAIHFAWLAITFFNPYALSFISSLGGSKIYITMLLLYFFSFNMVESKEDARLYIGVLVFISLVHGVAGFVQGLLGPESVLAIHPRYAVQLAKFQGLAFRPFGLSHLPGAPAIFIFPVVPFLLYFIYASRSWLMKIFLLIMLPVLTNLMLLCQIRSAIFKGLLGGALFLFGGLYLASKSSAAASRKVLLTGCVSILLLFSMMPYFLDYSVSSQKDNQAAIERSLTLFEYERVGNARRGAGERFLLYLGEVPFGAGFARVGAAAGAFKKTYREDVHFKPGYFFADNFWIATLVEVGLPGMIIMTSLIFLILWRGLSGLRLTRDPESKVLQLALMCSLISMVVGLYGAEGLLYNPESAIFWFFSGILMKLPRLETELDS